MKTKKKSLFYYYNNFPVGINIKKSFNNKNLFQSKASFEKTARTTRIQHIFDTHQAT